MTGGRYGPRRQTGGPLSGWARGRVAPPLSGYRGYLTPAATSRSRTARSPAWAASTGSARCRPPRAPPRSPQGAWPSSGWKGKDGHGELLKAALAAFSVAASVSRWLRSSRVRATLTAAIYCKRPFVWSTTARPVQVLGEALLDLALLGSPRLGPEPSPCPVRSGVTSEAYGDARIGPAVAVLGLAALGRPTAAARCFPRPRPAHPASLADAH